MSEDVTKKLAFVNLEIPECIDEAAKGLTQKASHAIGDTIADCWYLVFGGISEQAEKKRMKIARNLEEYRDSLCRAVEEIPPENQQEAKLSVIGPALEKSKYCVEETEIRDMFVRLISRSMDNRYSSSIHPSFPEIVSQMSPLDAENLKLFSVETTQLPIAEYRFVSGGARFSAVQTNVFLSNPNMQDIETQASSLTALSRLGLIVLKYEEHMTNDALYLPFEQHGFFSEMKECVANTPAEGFESPRDDYLVREAQIKKGTAKLTPLGQDFLKICLP